MKHDAWMNDPFWGRNANLSHAHMSSVLCDLWSDCTCENVACGWCICPHERPVGLFTSHHLSSSVQCIGQVFFLFRGSFSRRRSKQILRTSVIAGLCCSRRVVPRFTARHAMADFAMAVVNVPSAGMRWCEAESVFWEVCWARPSGSKSFLARCRVSLKILTICSIKPSSSEPSFTVSVETNDAVVPGTCQHLPGDL